MYVLRTPSPVQPGSILVLGETTFRDRRQRFGLLPEDRLRHLWVLGKTGSGKSTLLANCIAQDLAAGRGLALLDPHGDLVATALAQVPRFRINEVVLFAPADVEHPIAWNLFRQGRSLHPDRSLLAANLIAVFRKHWAAFWGPRLEHILRNAILAVAPDERATLVFLYRFLADQGLRAEVLETLSDPIVRQFWETEFPRWPAGLRAEAVLPVTNKLGAFVTNEKVRNIVGQVRSRLDLGDIMDRQGVLLADLGTGTIGEDASHLLGGLLLSSLQLAAMSRPRTELGRPVCSPGRLRPKGGDGFIVYADEFQHFVSESLATMLAEARKFGLGMVLAHQYLDQLPPALQAAMIGNVSNVVVYRLGASDAAVLAPEFAPVYTALDLQSLPRHEMAVKVVAEGRALPPFSARGLLPPRLPADAAEIAARVRSQSRERFAVPRSVAEAGLTFNP